MTENSGKLGMANKKHAFCNKIKVTPNTMPTAKQFTTDPKGNQAYLLAHHKDQNWSKFGVRRYISVPFTATCGTLLLDKS